MSCIIITDCNISEDSPGVLCPVTLTNTLQDQEDSDNKQETTNQCIQKLVHQTLDNILTKDQKKSFKKEKLSQTSFGHISINSLMILMVLMATERPQRDLSIDTSNVSKRSVLAEILGRSTSNHYGTIY